MTSSHKAFLNCCYFRTLSENLLLHGPFILHQCCLPKNCRHLWFSL